MKTAFLKIVEGGFLFLKYVIVDKGTEYNRRYFNIALKNKVDDEIKRLLNMQ